MAYDEELADRVREHVEQEGGLTEKKMFGGLAFLIDGRMAVCVGSKGGIMLRIDPADTEVLLRDPRARPFEMRGREMTGWLGIDVDARGERRGVGFVDSSWRRLRQVPATEVSLPGRETAVERPGSSGGSQRRRRHGSIIR